MKVITFSSLLFIQLTCFGQCKIDTSLISSFLKAYGPINLEDYMESSGNSECAVIRNDNYVFHLKDFTKNNQDLVFYSLLKIGKGQQRLIENYLEGKKVDHFTARKLSAYILCKYEPRYLEYIQERKRILAVSRQNNSIGEIYLVVEDQPEFPGGNKKMLAFIEKNIQYPYPAMISKTEGKVFVQFVIDYNGIIKGTTIVKGIGYGCDEEALRIVNSMPKWNPGMQDGLNVSVRYCVPVVFKLP